MLKQKRHTLAHYLAYAILNKYNDALITIGPPTENGFYYDIDLGENKISENDFSSIEEDMRELLLKKHKFVFDTIEEKDARELFKNNKYKLELIDEIVKKTDKITTSTFGDFTDLCEGGHVDSSEIDINSFKIAYISSVYWRADKTKDSLTRIYAYAFNTKEELDEFLSNLELAKENDHRKIGKELELFTFSKLIGAGLPLFTTEGAKLRNSLINIVSKIQSKYGYENVWIPHLTKKELYQKSGHVDKYKDDLFKVSGKNKDEFYLKPMNCPHHTQIFDSKLNSYKDMPARYSEFTTVYRDELHGELLGLTRVLSITQDDGHVFCTEEQIKEEVKNIILIIKEFYELFGLFSSGSFEVSVRDDEKDKYLGDDRLWDKAENILEEILKENNLEYKKVKGEAAFYGPKIDFKFEDSLKRIWQLGTIQLDFNQPERFKLFYVDKDGKRKQPVMIHRAVLGSVERFIGIYLEHSRGFLPFIISPKQVAILSVSEDSSEYVIHLNNRLKEKGINTFIDISNKKLGVKLQNIKNYRVPYKIIIGKKDIENKEITLERADGEKTTLKEDEVINRLVEENKF